MRHRLLVALVALVALATGFVLVGQSRGATATNLPRPAFAARPACADADVIFRLFTDSPVYLPGQTVRVGFEVRSSAPRWCTVAGQSEARAPISVFDAGGAVCVVRPRLH